MLNIYLVDLANDLIEIDNKSIPIGIGYIGAYCNEQFKDEIKIYAFRTLKPFLEKMETDSPDIVGFGCYDWNYNLSRKTAELIKKKYTKCLVVCGGASINQDPETNKVFLKENPYIDSLVLSDGEFPFSNLVRLMLKYQENDNAIELIKSTQVDGVRSLCNESIIMGAPVDIVTDLSIMPSPYLTGFFDELISNPILMPIIQNVRGCPYKCCFCVSGSQPQKLRNFPIERVIKEIDYLREHAKHRVLRFSDDNFGIMKGDLEIAHYLSESHEKYNYPSGVKMYLSKRLNERTCEIVNVLKKITLMNISFQSITPEVLENINRQNISQDKVKDCLAFARKNGIATGTELIFGLPGESLNSMKKVIDKVIELRFDSIYLGVLWLLNGTEIAGPKMREKYKYKSKFMLGENAITYLNDLLSIEVDEIAVASNRFTFQEWKYFIQFDFIFEFVLAFGYARELLFHALNFKIKASDFFQELIDNPDDCSVINNMSKLYRDKYLENLFDSEEEIYEFVKQNVRKWLKKEKNIYSLSKSRIRYDFFEKLLFMDPDYTVFDNFANAILKLYDGEQAALFKETTEHIKELTVKLIIDAKDYKEEVPFKSKYNLHQWIKDGYIKPIIDYVLPQCKEFYLKPRNPGIIEYVIKKDKEENRKSYFNYFRYTNSSDRRRIVKKWSE